MSSIRFIMLGGFLGAGKTTTIGRLARHYQDQGKNVGIVTNDQASDLVDTHTLRSQGFEVGEVPGACFCCSFDELTDTVASLEAHQHPDVILAEPVGSCTDLVATVIQPLKRLFDRKFEIAPYAVIFKPSHGKRILADESKAGFSPKASYIFRKQLEEADAIILNRVDELSEAEVDSLTRLVDEFRPGVTILPASAKTGAGFDALIEVLDQKGDFGRRILDLDYDVYAEGEAELGWLNQSLTVAADEPFELDAFLMDLITRLQHSLRDAQAETAHLKLIGLWEGFYAVANLISSEAAAQLSLPSGCNVRDANVIINARVATDPDLLHRHVDDAVQAACAAVNAAGEVKQTQCFRPARPEPTHRFGDAV